MNKPLCHEYMDRAKRLREITAELRELERQQDIITDEMYDLENFDLSDADLEYIRQQQEYE